MIMKSLFIFPCIFLYCLASESIGKHFEPGPSTAIRLSKRLERSKKDHQDLLQNNNDKRTQFDDTQDLKSPDISNSGLISVPGTHADRGVCHYNMNTSVIIKTNSSLIAGAKFLKYDLAPNSKDCAKKCCDTKGCNEAVFENKKDYSCYLFDCGNPSVCVFAPHNSYISMNFQQLNHQVDTSHEHLAAKHENELADLDTQVTSLDTNVQQSTTTTTSTTMHTSLPSTTLKKRTKIVSLDDVCTAADKCEDRHAECIQDKCRCQEGYIIKYGICRRECDKQHFECHKRGSENIGVDCIDLTYVCDGVPQCADGSDEFECSPPAFKDGRQNETPPYQADSNPQNMHTDKLRNMQLKQPVGRIVSHHHHDESSNKLLKQKGQLPIAKYNTETMIKKDKPKQALQNSKGRATSSPPVVQGQQFSHPNTNNHQGWVKSNHAKDLAPGNEGNSKKLSAQEGIIQPSSRETDRQRAKSATSNRMWNQNQMSQYQKHPDMNQQYVSKGGYLSNYPNQRQNINQVGPAHKQAGLIAEESQKFALNPQKSYNRINDPQQELLSGTNNQGQLPQTSRQLYQNVNQNYMDSQYVSDNGQYAPKQNLFAYPGSNYAYQQKVAAAYNNGYPIVQGQNSVMNPDGVSYVQNTGQANNWPEYSSDYMYTDQNSDYLPAITAQGYQYAPENGRINQGMHNLGNGKRPTDNAKQIHPNGSGKVLYSAADNKIRGNQPHQSTSNMNQAPVVRTDEQDHHKTGFHTESKMQAANANTDHQTDTGDSAVSQKAESTGNDKNDQGKGEAEKDSGVTNSNKEVTTTTTTTTVRSTTDNLNNTETANSAPKFFEHSNYILKKKVVVASPTDNAQGPIVALALGLSFTTMLLIFVGCRLHRVKRRLRKGRALHSNEADYLINGMYL